MERNKRLEKEFSDKASEICDISLEMAIELCIKDFVRNRFKNLKEHSDYYLNQILEVIQKFDFIVMFASYKSFIVNKYGYAYYYSHRELEVFITLITSKTGRKKFKNVREIFNDIPSRRELEILELQLRKFNAVFFLGENGYFGNYSENHLYHIYKSPEMMARFKTKHIRGEGSGTQYLDYLEEILALLDNKDIRKGKYSLSKTIDGFVDLINFSGINKVDEFKKNGLFHFLCVILPIFFQFERFSFWDFIRLVFSKKTKFFFMIFDTYRMDFYSGEELVKFFGTDSLPFIDSITMEISDLLINDIWIDNPIWTKPFLEFGNNRYLYPIPSLPLSFAEQMITNSLSEKEIEEYYSIKTSVFMERKISTLIKKYKNIRTFCGLMFDLNGRRYETDFLLLYKNVAIIIEAKGQNLNKKGRMGHSKRLDNRIKKIIEDSDIQASRLSTVIRERKKNNIFFDKGKETNIDFSDIDEVITLSVSFEWLIFFSMSMHQLRDKYMMSPGHIHCSLVEFEDIVDILETENQFTMYLYKRKLLEESKVRLKCDELDLITHFVQNAFMFQPNESGFFDITGEFDKSSNAAYFTVKHSFIRGNKHKYDEKFLGEINKQVFTYTEFINDHIDYAKRIFSGNFFLAGFFECLPNKVQLFIETQLYRLVKKVESKKELFSSSLKIDQFSPVMTLIIDTIGYEAIINDLINVQINKHNSDKNGHIIVIYKLLDSKLNIAKMIYRK